MKKNKLLRRLTAALLAAVLALSIALPVFASDDGDTIYINSVSDLLSLAKNCAYDQWSVGKTVILQKDLSLEGMLWEPIPSFSGQFKGNGHTISDLTITGQYSPAGLFGIVEEQGSIESLSVRGIVSVSDSADTTTGGIVGINHGTLINCQFTGVVTGDSEVGGIVGRNESEGTIDHSTARAIVTGKSSTGGIAGYNLGAITGCTNVGSINTEYQEASLDTDGFTAKMVDQINNKMAAADDDAYLHAQFGAGLDDIAHLPDDAEIQPRLLLAGQRFAADLEQDAFIFGFCFHKTTPHFFIFVVLL
mgnify:CR=1 FL=1